MRVIAGTARRLQLRTVKGMDTRPTTDRIKETLFNMLQPDLPGCSFLDLFAGSGGIGIEALSRGAARAVFVERDRKAAGCIRDNLALTHLDGKGSLLVCDVFKALEMMRGDEPFDLIFMDPPYDHEIERRVLEALPGTGLVTRETKIIVEASEKTDFSYLDQLGYRTEKRKEYKTNVHMFLRR